MQDITYIKKEYKGLNYIQFKLLLELGIKHAYTLKSDGFDFSFGREERKKSYNILAEALQIDNSMILEPVQTHTDNVLCVNDLDLDINNVDGLITNKKGIALTGKNADCILFLFYDPVKKVIANVHSGWKGTYKKISEITIKKMIKEYGCNVKDILIFISPSIRECCFEVENDVKTMFEEKFFYTNRTNEFIRTGRKINDVQKYNIDTVFINRILFKDLGINDNNIIDCGLCSCCNKNSIHSARAEGENFKRGTAIIVL